MAEVLSFTEQYSDTYDCCKNDPELAKLVQERIDKMSPFLKWSKATKVITSLEYNSQTYKLELHTS